MKERISRLVAILVLPPSPADGPGVVTPCSRQRRHSHRHQRAAQHTDAQPRQQPPVAGTLTDPAGQLFRSRFDPRARRGATRTYAISPRFASISPPRRRPIPCLPARAG